MRYAILSFILLSLAMAWFVRDNRQLHGELQRVSQELSQKNAMLVEQAKRNKARQKKQLEVQRNLEDQLQTNQQKHLQLQAFYRRLKREKTYKKWSSKPLPPAVVQLLKRKTASGTSEYIKQLPNRKPLHAQSNKPENE